LLFKRWAALLVVALALESLAWFEVLAAVEWPATSLARVVLEYWARLVLAS
jgi:hypothetical protein